MDYKIIPPCEELKSIINYFWVATWDRNSDKANTIHYVIANSSTEITFAFSGNLSDSELLFSIIQGHTNQPSRISVEGFYHLIGVAFNSFAIPKLFRIPASELSKEFLSMETFLGHDGRILNEKMALAGSTYERIEILSDYFKSILIKSNNEDRLITDAIDQIKKKKGILKINDLSKVYNLSEKQFKRRFKAFTGFNPKIYSRIIRFESVIQSLDTLQNLTEAAYTYGYYDQAHLNHEFKSFTGFSPIDFWKLSE